MIASLAGEQLNVTQGAAGPMDQPRGAGPERWPAQYIAAGYGWVIDLETSSTKGVGPTDKNFRVLLRSANQIRDGDVCCVSSLDTPGTGGQRLDPDRPRFCAVGKTA